ncbi:MAG: NUDIX domain-containing protein [Tissierellia bacterium]|jgi:ADP-ribose pyrophosphatase YjhB (NUDIX family)|nr:NUDIX domain-containing protein [Tissierellia bacterium]
MIISAGGVVISESKVLLLLNTKGKWVLPKGHVEENESLRSAAVREVREESGLEAKIQKKLGWIEYSFYHQGRNHNKKVLWFKMRRTGGIPQPLRQEGFVDFGFFALEDLPESQMHENELLMIQKAFTC